MLSSSFRALVLAWHTGVVPTRLLCPNDWTDREGRSLQHRLLLHLTEVRGSHPCRRQGVAWQRVHQRPVEHLRHQIANELQRLLLVGWGVFVSLCAPTHTYTHKLIFIHIRIQCIHMSNKTLKWFNPQEKINVSYWMSSAITLTTWTTYQQTHKRKGSFFRSYSDSPSQTLEANNG